MASAWGNSWKRNGSDAWGTSWGGIVGAIVTAVGLAVGTSTAVAIGRAYFRAIAISAGISTGVGIGISTARSVFNSVGSSVVTAIAEIFGPIADLFLSDIKGPTKQRKPGVPKGTKMWLKTIVETLTGRRGNKIVTIDEHTLTFSDPPTKEELEKLYEYANKARQKAEEVVKRIDT